MCRLRREHGLKIHTVMQEVQLHIGSLMIIGRHIFVPKKTVRPQNLYLVQVSDEHKWQADGAHTSTDQELWRRGWFRVRTPGLGLELQLCVARKLSSSVFFNLHQNTELESWMTLIKVPEKHISKPG